MKNTEFKQQTTTNQTKVLEYCYNDINSITLLGKNCELTLVNCFREKDILLKFLIYFYFV